MVDVGAADEVDQAYEKEQQDESDKSDDQGELIARFRCALLLWLALLHEILRNPNPKIGIRGSQRLFRGMLSSGCESPDGF